MSLISSNYHLRCRSSSEKKREGDEKQNSVHMNGEIRRSRMNLPKYSEANPPISSSLKEADLDLKKSREIAHNLLTSSNEPLRLEISQRMSVQPKYIPYKLDQKVFQRLKLYGYHIPFDMKEEKPKPLQEFLKIASVQKGTLGGSYKSKVHHEKPSSSHFRNNRSFSRNKVGQTNTSFEVNGSHLFEAKQGYGSPDAERERKEKEISRRGNSQPGTNSNFFMNQLTLYTSLGTYGEYMKQKGGGGRKSKHSQELEIKYFKQGPKGQRPSTDNPLYTVHTETDQICEDVYNGLISQAIGSVLQGAQNDRKETQKVNPFINQQRFGNLQQIEEYARKRAEASGTSGINKSTIPSRLVSEGPSYNGSSASPTKDEKPLDVSIQNTGPISSRESVSSNINNKAKPVAAPSIKLKKAQTLFTPSKSLEACEVATGDRSTTATTNATPIGTNSQESNNNPSISPFALAGNSIPAFQNYNMRNVTITGVRVVSKSPPKFLPTNTAPRTTSQNPALKNYTQTVTTIKNRTNFLPSAVNPSSRQEQTRIANNSSPPVFKSQQVSQSKPNVNMVAKVEERDKKRAMFQAMQPTIFKYFVGRGNNSRLIKRVFKLRNWWEETPIYDQTYNLKWQQTYRGFKYERLIGNPALKQLVNHFEYHGEISTKNGLIRSLSSYCDANKLNLSEITPTTFTFNMDDEVNFDTDMQRFSQFFIKNYSDSNFYPRPDPNDKKNSDVWYNYDYRRKGKYNPPNLSVERNNSPYLKPKMHKTFLKGCNVWVIKPTGLNRGRGIEIFNTLDSLNEIMNQYFSRVPHLRQKKAEESDKDSSEASDEEEDEKKKRGPVIKSRTFVIQKYIEDLMVVNNRKFDIRVWVLVTQDMQLYFFKEGYLRTCSEVYTLDENHILDKFVHLTNNAIQRYGENYGNHEHGNQLSFQDLQKYIEEKNLGLDFQGKALPKMKELVTISMQSVKKTLNLNERKHCFEVFGYDFMIDAEYNVWLIEVNTNPCLDESSPLLGQLLPRMIDDAFKLTVDVMFPKPEKPKKDVLRSSLGKYRKASEDEVESLSSVESDAVVDDKEASMPETAQKSSNFHVDGYSDEENMWEYLCSIQYQRPPPKKDLNKNK